MVKPSQLALFDRGGDMKLGALGWAMEWELRPA